jgi:hypothetical protein
MQFQVPQKIDLEDKVIGPFTLKQFFYLLAGGMLDYLWLKFFSITIAVLLIIPTSIFFIAMAVARVQDQPFPKFLGSLILFMFKPKQRTWGRGAPQPKLIISKGNELKEIQPEAKQPTQGELEKLSAILDTKGWRKNDADIKQRVVSQVEVKPKIKI